MSSSCDSFLSSHIKSKSSPLYYSPDSDAAALIPVMNRTAANTTSPVTAAAQESVSHLETKVSDTLWASVGIVIIIIGTVGHILSISVMTSSQKLRKQSSTIYLITMSITGIVSLYTGLVRYVIFIGVTGWELDIRDNSNAICKMHMMITYASLQYFAWLQATVAVDRLISVNNPHKYMVSCKWKMGILVVLIELLCVGLLNFAVAYSVGANDDGYCVPQNHEFWYNIWGYIDLVSFSLLPAAIMIFCNCVILIILKQSKMKVGTSSSALARSLTVMLMSLNVLFLITTLPVSIVFFLNWGDYGSKQYAATELSWTVFSLLQYAGSACTFFVYCVTGSKFREELRMMLSRTCSCVSKKSATRTSLRPINSQAASVNNGTRSIRDYNSLNVSMNVETTSVTSFSL